MLAVGQQVELTIEKPAAGGWMIARHHGQVVLVRGAIPGERVKAWIDRTGNRMAYAITREVVEASPDRRQPGCDPLCGGALYAHIAYERQGALKGEIIQDAFTRLGRHPLERVPEVEGSPEAGYRMRARFHVRGAHAGFYKEGTHQLCDAAATRQMRDDAVASVQRVAQILEAASAGSVSAISLTENIDASQRAAFVELAPAARVDAAALTAAMDAGGLRGISTSSAVGDIIEAREPFVADPVSAITTGRAAEGSIRRHAASFFQGNRFLIPALVGAVLELVPESGHVVDLYAGAGLFAVSLAAIGHLEVTAVEADRSSGADLRVNARPYDPRIRAEVLRVEEYLAACRPGAIDTLIVDPPRSGLSPDALAGVVRAQPPLIVYVSCDPPTLARDARRLLDAGYRLRSVRGFDLFPNTPHVEALAVFDHPNEPSR